MTLNAKDKVPMVNVLQPVMGMGYAKSNVEVIMIANGVRGVLKSLAKHMGFASANVKDKKNVVTYKFVNQTPMVFRFA